MPAGDLRHLAEVEEITIGFTRPDGSTGSTPVWVVQAGEEVFVRSLRGRRGGWYRRLRVNPDGEVGDRAHIHPVRARPVEDAGTVEAVTGASAAKYGDSPYVGSLLTEEAADATLRLEPRAVTTEAAGRHSAELGHHLPAQACPFIASSGSRCSGQGSSDPWWPGWGWALWPTWSSSCGYRQKGRPARPARSPSGRHGLRSARAMGRLAPVHTGRPLRLAGQHGRECGAAVDPPGPGRQLHRPAIGWSTPTR